MTELLAWWDGNVVNSRASVLFCYALGKAQRVLAEIGRRTDREVFVHGAIDALLDAYRAAGVALAPSRPVAAEARGRSFAGELILAPPTAFGSPWLRRFGDAGTGFASGWMRVRGHRRRRGFDRGFVLSDHVDWPGLLETIRATGAGRVFAAHGYDAARAAFSLTGQRLGRLVSGRALREWALRFTGLPDWLLIDAHAAVGDSAETVTLLLDEQEAVGEMAA